MMKDGILLEVSLYLPSRKRRYVMWFGHGSAHHGQVPWFSIVREEFDNQGEVDWASQIFSLGSFKLKERT